MKICLVIGHSQKSQGAHNETHGVTEFKFNKKLVIAIEKELKDIDNLCCEIIYRKTYRGLPSAINKAKPDIVISFHSNAFNGKVKGTETLYYYRSEKGKVLAQKLQDAMVNALSLPDRGIKPKHTDSRGGYLLRYTDAPCVILEPFFLDNDSDFKTVFNNFNKLKEGIVNVIKKIQEEEKGSSRES